MKAFAISILTQLVANSHSFCSAHHHHLFLALRGSPRLLTLHLPSTQGLMGLEVESESVGAGIYGGACLEDEDDRPCIGPCALGSTSLSGLVYAGEGYSSLVQAVRTAVSGVLDDFGGEWRDVVGTGGATAMHVACMSQSGEVAVPTLIERGFEFDKNDIYGYTAMQHAAIADLGLAAEALIEAGAQHRARGQNEEGMSARDLALRYRSFKVVKVMQQYELKNGISLPEGEYVL